MADKKDSRLPKLYVVSDPSIINLLSETESCDFEKTIEKAEIEIKANKMKAEASTSARTEEISNASKLISVDESERINICNDADWCELSLFRLKAVASDFRPCYLNFPFHIAAITNKMLNIYEDEEETDLHDFLSNEDLCIMSLHQSDEDQVFTLIFEPKYRIRPSAQRIRDKLNEFICTRNMRFGTEITEDSDFFVDSWKRSPLHKACASQHSKQPKLVKKTHKR